MARARTSIARRGDVVMRLVSGLRRLTAWRKVARMACTYAVGDMTSVYKQGVTLYGYLD